MNKTMILAIVAASIVAPFVISTVQAGPCDSNGTPALGIVELPAAGGHIIYVDDRNFAMANGLWIYEETNGVYVGDASGSTGSNGHLQRGSTSDIFPSTDATSSVDPCVDSRPDGTDPDQDHF